MSHRLLRKGSDHSLAVCLGCVHSFAMTNKSALLNERYGKVVVNVASHATKPMVKRACEAMFGFKIKAIKVINRAGGARVLRGRKSKFSSSKKMILDIIGSFSINDMLGGSE